MKTTNLFINFIHCSYTIKRVILCIGVHLKCLLLWGKLDPTCVILQRWAAGGSSSSLRRVGVCCRAVGCIFGELLNSSPLFPGENDIEQLCCVLRVLGTPTQDSWPVERTHTHTRHRSFKWPAVAAVSDDITACYCWLCRRWWSCQITTKSPLRRILRSHWRRLSPTRRRRPSTFSTGSWSTRPNSAAPPNRYGTGGGPQIGILLFSI